MNFTELKLWADSSFQEHMFSKQSLLDLVRDIEIRLSEHVYPHIKKDLTQFNDDQITSDLTSFFYTLLRDHCLPGTVEQVVQDVEKHRDIIMRYSNKYLAEYAREISLRLLEK